MVLSSLATFLRLSTAPEGPTIAASEGTRSVPDVPTWFMAPAFPTRRAYDSYIEQVGATSRQARDYGLEHPLTTGVTISSTSILGQDSQVALAQVSDIFAELTSEGSTSNNLQDLPSSPDQLLRTLLPILVSAFLDSGPTAFSPEAAAAPSTSTALESATNTVIAVAEIARDLWRALLRDMHRANNNSYRDIMSGMEKLIAHMAAYFPFGNDELLKRTSSDSTKLQNLNITFCELVALVSLASNSSKSSTNSHAAAGQASASTKTRRTKRKTDNATAAMSKYIAALLQATKSQSILTSGATVTPQMYAQLLPTIWSLLWNSANGLMEEDILEVVVRHFLDLPSTSGVKKLAFQFVSRLLMVSCFMYERGVVSLADLPLSQLPDICTAIRSQPLGVRLVRLKAEILHDELLAALPRYLWELGTRDEELSLRIVSYIRHVITVGSTSKVNAKNLATYMAPYFTSKHPKKGLVPGPWTKLHDDDTVIAALEAVCWLRAEDLPSTVSASLETAVENAIKARDTQGLQQWWTTTTLRLGDIV